ncbi:MAG: hypothetical protein JNM84_23700 [Planctomycetes bacterium]|nr:hypothetical protein [Planctomycetota bacterium]
MLSVLPFLLAPLCLSAFQDPAASPAHDWLRRDGDRVHLEVRAAEPPTLLDLVRACERVSGPRFYLQRGEEEQLARERLSAIAPLQLPVDQLFALVQGILRAHDMACAVVAEEPQLVVRAVRLQGDGIHAVRASTRFLDESEIPAHARDQGLLFSTYLPLRHIEAAQAVQMLARSFSNSALEGFGSQGGPSGEQGLYVVGFGPTLQSMRELIRRVDAAPPALELGNLHCEVWQIEGASLLEAVEALVAAGNAREAHAFVAQAAEGAKRLARYQGPASTGRPVRMNSSWSGDEERFGAILELQPELAEGGALRVGISLQVKGESARTGIDASIAGSAMLTVAGMQVLLSSSPRGATLLFVGRS